MNKIKDKKDKKLLFLNFYTILVIQALAHSFICCAFFDTPSFINDITPK